MLFAHEALVVREMSLVLWRVYRAHIRLISERGDRVRREVMQRGCLGLCVAHGSPIVICGELAGTGFKQLL